MSTTNPVFQVLVPTGNQAILPAGSREDALAVGQLGFFNYHTGLSVDGSTPQNGEDLYISVGVNRSGGSTIEDIVRSSGQVIQKRNMKSITLKPHVTSQPKIVEVAGYIAKCETDYAIKVEFRGQKSYMTNGFGQFTKTFTFRTGCCTDIDCESCPKGDCNELAVGMAAAINADVEKLVTASLFINRINATVATEPTASGDIVVTIAGIATTVAILDADTVTTAAAKIVAAVNANPLSKVVGTSALGVMSFYPKATVVGATDTFVYTIALAGLTITTIVAATKIDVTDAAAFRAAVTGACMGIRLTGGTDAAVPMNGSIPIKYYNPRGFDFLVSLVQGFNCNGTQTLIQSLRYEEGAGQELQFLEYIAGGWNGKPGPYRVSSVTGLQRGNYDYFSVATAKYNVISLTYDQFSVGGWLEYLNNLETIIAIPCADTTTLVGFFAVSDLIYTQLRPMTNDAAGIDCTNISVNATNNVEIDGIESLS